MNNVKRLFEVPPGSRREILNELVKAALTKIVVLGAALGQISQYLHAPMVVVKTVLDVVLITIFGKDSFVLAFDYLPKYTKAICKSLILYTNRVLPKNQLIKEINQLYDQLDLEIEKKKNLVKLTYIVLVSLITAFIVVSIVSLIEKKKITTQSFVRVLLNELKEHKVKSSIKYILIPCMIIALVIFIQLIKRDIRFKQELQKELYKLRNEVIHSTHIRVAFKKKDYAKVLEEISRIVSKQNYKK